MSETSNVMVETKSPESCVTFSKVSRDEYNKICPSARYITMTEDNYSNLRLPVRSTKMSAGYDFYSPETFELRPGESVIVPTYVCAKMCPDTVLLIFPRSSVAIKKGVTLVNSVAVVDADYINADNGGHIMLAFKNNKKKSIFPWTNKKNTWYVNIGDKIAQGVFVKYGITFDDNADADRTGGIGSTGA